MTRAVFVALTLVITTSGVAPAQTRDISLDLKSPSSRPGDAVLATVTVPEDVTGVSVEAFGAKRPAYRVARTKWLALLGIDLGQRPGSYAVTATATGARTVQTRRDLTVVARRFRQRVLKVAPEFVNPPPAQLARIEREAAFMRAVYDESDGEAAWRDGLTRPVAEPANSSFGTRSVFNGQPRSPHAGTDFLSPAGTPIHAPASGRVVGARDLFFTGNTVVIDHGLGVFSMLAHLSRLDVREGQQIERGDVIGLVGATGRVTGAHLHWALRIGTARVDPLSALDVLGVR